ncbi:MAG: ribosomal protein S18-alanine N-acetyltransferase [Legionella sp.]|uniref:ribosomal protein S18-alanine N-acetyltransferase n=1 Tax=Legionella sp. TaxID=459 RepID=UPI0039E2AC33
MNYNIRPMTEADIDDVYAIEITTHIAPWKKSIIKDCVRAGYNCLILEIQIREQRVISGYIICREKDGYCHLLNFCIAKHFQSKGYGRKFLEYLVATISENKEMAYIILEVRPSNKTAVHLYESFGFKINKIKKAYYTDNEFIEDAIVFKKNL